MPFLERRGLTFNGKRAWISFKKPFRAIPVRLGPYHKAQQRRQQSIAAAKVLGLATAGGLVIGLFTAADPSGSPTEIGSIVREMAVSSGLARKSTPMPGAYYSGCNDARAAGVAPLYAGEPGCG